jgi:hypothetical protein
MLAYVSGGGADGLRTETSVHRLSASDGRAPVLLSGLTEGKVDPARLADSCPGAASAEGGALEWTSGAEERGAAAAPVGSAAPTPVGRRKTSTTARGATRRAHLRTPPGGLDRPRTDPDLSPP